MPKLRQIHDGTTISELELDESPVFIGRAAGNAVQLDDSTISGRHAVINPVPSKYLENSIDYRLEDLESTNGTTVNGNKIDSCILKHGDHIRVGHHEFYFSQPESSNLEATDIIIPE